MRQKLRSLNPEHSSMTNSYFGLLAERKLEAARRALDDIRQAVHSTQWEKGYVNSLEGMHEASKSKGDEKLLINKVDSGKTSRLRMEFAHRSTSVLQADFDRGFFSAWADYMRFIGKKEAQSEIDYFMENSPT